jgi:cytochrome c
MRHSRALVFIAGFVLIGAVTLDSLRTYAASDDGGKEAFSQCAACHTTDGSAGVGPTLKGVVGRQSASVPGFPYSGAMKRSHLVWTADQLDKYIANPQGAVPGNAMPYAGMSDAAQRSALIAYLETLK